MRKALLLSALLITGLYVNAQNLSYDEMAKRYTETKNMDTIAWIYSGALTMGINQGILHNWAAGGELASLTVNGLFNGNLTRYYNRSVWSNTFDAAYGLFYAYSNNFIPRKTDDRIDFTSKYGYRLSKTSDLYFTGLLNAKTQFSKGYNYDAPAWDTFSTSNFLSPLYITIAPGIEYRKGSNLTLFLSPAASRLTFVSDYYTLQDSAGMYGVEYGKTFRFELGAYFSGRYIKDFTKNISYRGRLDLYTNYLAKDKKVGTDIVKKDNPGNVDVLIDNAISFKFYKFFSLNIGLVAIYDNDVPFEKDFEDGSVKKEPINGLGWWQLKQFMSFGFNYKF
ncbi:DUF3078 domain-containing protein [Taibaiella lutea]|uniref:DUF3078 domain-containing protein n=1 Tax=Taibaiella lutea TaxID=2608001 RepID=A0A5M6CGQ7_9BACT|nr:DUF3078 domain-containing protein [Taibaiella lutea]KAA5532605.1 DUF3078 domain-containing protein [Taibaiella lutea]